MVLYYMFPSGTPEDVVAPSMLMTTHNVFKGFQWGLAGGLCLGVFAASRKPVLNWGVMRQTTTSWMRNTSLVSGLAIAPAYTVTQMASVDDKQQYAYDLQHDKAQNRLHVLTLYGAAAGMLLSRRLMGMDVTARGIEKVFGVTGGGLVLGAFAGFCMDFPLSVFVPIYTSHVDDIDLNFPALAGLADDEE